METFDHKRIEKKWQDAWEKANIYHASDSSKSKKFVLIEFPYPSGEGLHMGHLRPFLAGDIYSRAKRMQGFETMYPIGWDAFGLPTENAAIKSGIHPMKLTKRNTDNPSNKKAATRQKVNEFKKRIPSFLNKVSEMRVQTPGEGVRSSHCSLFSLTNFSSFSLIFYLLPGFPGASFLTC